MPSAQELPKFLSFPTLDLLDPENLPWGAAALADDFEKAREIFNKCTPKFREALAFFKLDGFVTQHVELLFSFSKAYSCAPSSTLVTCNALCSGRQAPPICSPCSRAASGLT